MVSGVQRVKEGDGVLAGGSRTKVPGTGRGPGADRLAFGAHSTCKWHPCCMRLSLSRSLEERSGWAKEERRSMVVRRVGRRRE